MGDSHAKTKVERSPVVWVDVPVAPRPVPVVVDLLAAAQWVSRMVMALSCNGSAGLIPMTCSTSLVKTPSPLVHEVLLLV